jgi:methyltransferase (TIGR00027 family)
VSYSEPLIRNISDTARWAAVYRARESDRPDALFRDRFAARLAGTRGEQIAGSIPQRNEHSWAWVTRTYLFDQFIREQVDQGVDMVLNLAAGLDARPYRMDLPSSLKWVEVDFPEPLAYKEEILAGETAACPVERIRLDLSDEPARRALFDRLGGQAKKTLVLTEGLLIYLTADQVGSLARDLARPSSFRRWVFEVASPGLLQMLKRSLDPKLAEGGLSLKFAPEEGPLFFIRHGWKPLEIRSMLKTAARLKRVSFWMRLMAKLPESTGKQGSRPWSGICLMDKELASARAGADDTA